MQRTHKTPDNSDTPVAETADDAVSSAYSHEISQAALNRRREIAVEAQPSEAERAAIQTQLGLLSLDSLRLSGALRPHGRHGWALAGLVEASLAQECVATLDPAPAEIHESVERLWLPAEELAALEAAKEETSVDPDELDLDAEEPELLPERLDLGPVVVEALALALDPYPRAPGADFADAIAGPPGVAPMTDEDARPFAGLADLKARLEAAQPEARTPADDDAGTED